MRTLVIATRNRHKVLEIATVLGREVVCRSLTDFPEAPAVVEDADTFAGNATKKAVSLANWLASSQSAGAALDGVLADDSGLEVDALGGAPGVHSARFAALDGDSPGNSTDAENNTKLLGLLRAVPWEQRTARFRCTLALARPGVAEALLFEGRCEGRILFTPRGHHGFGYDPLFQPLGFEASFAELGETIKNQISHRAQALRHLQAWLRPAKGVGQ